VQSCIQIITTNKPTSSSFAGQIPFLSPSQQCRSTDVVHRVLLRASCRVLLLFLVHRVQLRASCTVSLLFLVHRVLLRASCTVSLSFLVHHVLLRALCTVSLLFLVPRVLFRASCKVSLLFVIHRVLLRASCTVSLLFLDHPILFCSSCTFSLLFLVHHVLFRASCTVSLLFLVLRLLLFLYTVSCIVYIFTVVSGPPCTVPCINTCHIRLNCLPQAHLGLPTLYLTTNSSWLPWRRVAMPVISPVIPLYCQTV